MDGVRLLSDLLAGDRHVGGLRCRRLFDIEPQAMERLADETDALRRACPPSFPTDASHVTSWVGPVGEVATWSLLNRTGRTDDFSNDHDMSARNKWFYHSQVAPTIAELVAGLTDVVNCRVAALGPGARLPPHEEHVLFRTAAGNVGGRGRLHVPIETDERAEMVLDGSVVHLSRGGVFLVNHGCVHEAGNSSNRTRVHLVLDVLLTQRQIDGLCGQGAPPATWCLSPERSVVPVRGVQPLGAYRRLPPSVPEYVAELHPCEPQ